MFPELQAMQSYELLNERLFPFDVSRLEEARCASIDRGINLV